VSEGTGWVSQYEDDPGNGSGGPPRPPIWVVVVVALSVVGGVWLLVTQRSTGSVLDSSPTTTTIPFEPSFATTTTAPLVTSTTEQQAAGDPVSVFGNPPISITPETPEQLRGYVAVTSPDDPPFNQNTVWVFRPGGSLVSRSGNVIGRVNVEYPMLITAGHLILGGQIFDIDLAEPPISLWTDGRLIAGSGPGDVWVTQLPVPGSFVDDDRDSWVLPVDVASLTVGERVVVTDLFYAPIVGVAGGLLVNDFGRTSFWSPTDGLVPLESIDLRTVVAASGDLVVVASPDQVTALDVVTGEDIGSIKVEFTDPVRSACLSPDREHVILVAWNGEAVVGNIATGEVIDLNEVVEHYDDLTESIQQDHGIGWTANDQLVFIAQGEGSRNVFGYDIATGEGFHVATLDSPAPWWLTASGTMC
jgi:hypothetical protein